MTRDSVNQGRPGFLMGKTHTRYHDLPVIVGWFTGRTWKISQWCTWPAELLWCRPPVGDAGRKRNCTLNRPLGTLQLPRAPLIVNVVSVAVLITCAVLICRFRQLKFENFHLFQSLHYYARNSEFCRNLFSALCHIVCAYYTHFKTAHKLGYHYIYWREILCGSLLVWTVFLSGPKVT